MINIDEKEFNSLAYGDDPYFWMSLPDYGGWVSELYEKYRPHIFKCKKRSEWESLGIIPDNESDEAKILQKTDGYVTFRPISFELAEEKAKEPQTLNLYEKQHLEIKNSLITNQITTTAVNGSFIQYSGLMNGSIYRFTSEQLEEDFNRTRWEIRRVIPFEDCDNFYELAPFTEKPSFIFKRFNEHKDEILAYVITSVLNGRLDKINSLKTIKPKQNLAQKTIDELNILLGSLTSIYRDQFDDVLQRLEQFLPNK